MIFNSKPQLQQQNVKKHSHQLNNSQKINKKIADSNYFFFGLYVFYTSQIKNVILKLCFFEKYFNLQICFYLFLNSWTNGLDSSY